MNPATKQRIKFWSWVALLTGGIIAIMLMFSAVAHADPNVVTEANQATDLGWSVIAHQGPIFGSLLLANGLLRAFLKANESKHWLAQGKTLAIITGIGMIAGAAIDWKWNGGAASGVINALFVAVGLVMHSTVQPKPAEPSTGAASNVALLAVTAGLIGAAMVPACTHSDRVSAAKAGGKIVWDCTAPERAKAVDALIPLATSAIRAAASADGKLIDTAKVKEAFSTANLKSDAGALAVCVAMSSFQALIAAASAPKPATGTASAEFELDPAALRRAMDDLRAAQFPDAEIKTQEGQL